MILPHPSGPRAKPSMLTAERLREVLDYDAETGIFRWKASCSNQKRVGDIAGSVSKSGYRQIRVERRLYLAHRLAWLYVTGHWPDGDVDHKNMIPGDDWFENLRNATNSQNQQNQRKAHTHNKTGLLGVQQRGRRFVAQITVNGVQRYLGLFPTPETAHAAYLEAKRRLHPWSTL